MISKRKKQMLLFFLKDKNKKKWFRIIKEFTVLSISRKELPLNYISHLLYRKNVFNYKDYLSLKENRKLLQWSHSQAKEQTVFVENKLLFEQLLAKNDIPTPRIFFHNSKNRFTYKGKAFEVRTKNDFISLLEKVFKEEEAERIFCKPIDGIRGEDIFVLDKQTHQRIADSLVDLIFSRAFIFQELIVQHEDLKRINSSSVNTLRIVSYKGQNEKTEILSAFIRVGRKGAIMDNAHMGGIVIPLNKSTGKMGAQGLQLIDNGGGIFYEHPDTEIIFEDLKVPLFVQVKEIVAKASTLFKFPLLGWDVAVTKNGPAIIEANHDFHLLLSDLTEQGLKRNPAVREILGQIN